MRQFTQYTSHTTEHGQISYHLHRLLPHLPSFPLPLSLFVHHRPLYPLTFPRPSSGTSLPVRRVGRAAVAALSRRHIPSASHDKYRRYRRPRPPDHGVAPLSCSERNVSQVARAWYTCVYPARVTHVSHVHISHTRIPRTCLFAPFLRPAPTSNNASYASCPRLAAISLASCTHSPHKPHSSLRIEPRRRRCGSKYLPGHHSPDCVAVWDALPRARHPQLPASSTAPPRPASHRPRPVPPASNASEPLPAGMSEKEGETSRRTRQPER